jgi:zinc/manganese transport system substrate-binding protein
MHRCIYLAFFLLTAPLAQADLTVFSCEPEWKALAEEIGGDLVTADSATHALQDPHYIQARPSLIAKLRKSDLLICSGADLEIGWLPQLLLKANNPGVRPGNIGYFEASSFVPRLDVPASVDRAKGDMHPQGNPHVQANPHNMLIIAQALAGTMAQLDPANADGYRQGAADFLERWQEAIAAWEDRAGVLRGKRVIVHHKSWVYLQDWLGLVEVATLEPVPGVPPTANHLGELLRMLGEEGDGAEYIIRAPYQSDKASLWLSERTGIPTLVLPLTVGGSEDVTDLFSLFDDILDRLLEVSP